MAAMMVKKMLGVAPAAPNPSKRNRETGSASQPSGRNRGGPLKEDGHHALDIITHILGLLEGGLSSSREPFHLANAPARIARTRVAVKPDALEDHGGQLAPEGLQVLLEKMVRLALGGIVERKEIKEIVGLRVTMENKVLREYQDLKASQEREEKKGKLEKRDPREILDPGGSPGQMVISDPRVTVVTKEKQVRKATPARKENVENVVRLVKKVKEGLKANRMRQELPDHQPRLALRTLLEQMKRRIIKKSNSGPRDVAVGDLVFTVTCDEAMEENRVTINTRSIEEAMIICAAWPDCHQVSTLPEGNVEGSKSKKLKEALYKVKGGANAKLKSTRPSTNVSDEVQAVYGRGCPKIDQHTVTFGPNTFKITCAQEAPVFQELRGTRTGDEPVDCIALCASEPDCQAITQVKKDGVSKCVMISKITGDLQSGGGYFVAQRVR
ncbi:uncharacterized protein ACLA_043860 [Aspergillus clavatus NRRL 1]|uniref:Uncharacterized protein n=1 Tax=Aspergillus clavatus (strain ATCC 1007 / CBS 513.65 / DSM 816 / NCTC 3887 / NRRL 1 / QM 1276 / 107) TaxID=344612 RepID=A1C8M9_ASPCL|nr:uncharacterized protein ACLA_043860 [Aspergillus clavatus NRRL 1]EAW13666.1 hypothetical protein ACLA_043860 [Aspergillus clavatus NRRL 1]